MAYPSKKDCGSHFYPNQGLELCERTGILMRKVALQFHHQEVDIRLKVRLRRKDVENQDMILDHRNSDHDYQKTFVKLVRYHGWTWSIVVYFSSGLLAIMYFVIIQKRFTCSTIKLWILNGNLKWFLLAQNKYSIRCYPSPKHVIEPFLQGVL